ncbi:lysosomal alpha-mannosidase [Klebsormidium nitens]|uniref:Alpha-mannosidase n=1 Tax=Klebsormidium nitens TaxID=105231 RepID=A0A1Y1IDC6_KLENI|nr:lysosomal alpha-mannosidase [Klebsormidium nitens]|eukprot:GAQ86088.1 lysosomal alpha-mannosidase [Klebsormidium nitens]
MALVSLLVKALLSLVLLLPFSSAAWEGEAQLPPDEYNTKGGPVKDKLNVHLVAHTHDDVGWLKTVDQYYVGSNNSIQFAGVQWILDSVVQSLAQNPDRKFIYVEQAFFQRWWRQQNKKTRKVVQKLVKDGQLEFINGGWCMHDEATTYYVDMIDQTALGHRYIRDQFDQYPRIGWQIDPFGHSAVQASLLTAELGFDGLFFARADYDDVKKRREEKSMEMVWRASKSLGKSAETFAGVMGHHYDTPVGFNFDMWSKDPPIQDDPRLYDVNVAERIEAFIKDNLAQAAQFRTNNIMLSMGADFVYSNANTWFTNMDKLIHYANKDGRVNVFYSTPSIYLDAKYEANETWPLKTDDFFPYADCPHCYWTGYFASRVGLKGYTRALSGYLQAARQLEFLVGRSATGPNTDELEEAMAIVQHHDGVSGTEKQHVADDYAKRLAIGAAEAGAVVANALVTLTAGQKAGAKEGLSSSADGFMHARVLLNEKAAPQADHDSEGHAFEQCPLLNISSCPITEKLIEEDTSLVVVAYNSLAWPRTELVRFPVASQLLAVTDMYGNPVPSQVAPIHHVTRTLRARHVAADQEAPFELTFLAGVPPLGFATYFLGTKQAGQPGLAAVAVEEPVNGFGTDFDIGRGALKLTFGGDSGSLKRIANKRTQTSLGVVHQSMFWYNASDGNTEANPLQASGAYIFRPNSSTEYPLWDTAADTFPRLSTVRGPLYEEVRQELSPWAVQTFRVSTDGADADVQYTVGPIPIDDGLGKEVVMRLETDIQNGKTFFTDSNGRDLIQRVVDKRPTWKLNVTEPVAGNYYPVNAAILIRDAATQLTVLTDRSLGGASLADGQVDVMLHRRLLHDDARGVGEPLNETAYGEGLVTRGVLKVGVHPTNESARWLRENALRVYSPLQLAFTTQKSGGAPAWLRSHRGSFSGLREGAQLPPNVALTTLQQLPDGTVLLRLAHLYEVDEDPELSQLARVNLRALFPTKIEKATELTLSGNQPKSAVKKKVWRVEGEESTRHASLRGGPFKDDDLTVELGPLEIRTFGILFAEKVM